MASEGARPARDAVVAAESLRFRGGRRPFLAKKRLVTGEGAQDGAEESERETQDWWVQRSTQVREWLRSNPLHLGLEEMAVKMVQQMLREGDALAVEDPRKLKCWLHICIELGDVPGSPLHPEDKIDSEIRARAHLENGRRALGPAPASPETCDDDLDLAQPLLPVIGAEARLGPVEVGSMEKVVQGNNAAPSPRHASTQTDVLAQSDLVPALPTHTVGAAAPVSSSSRRTQARDAAKTSEKPAPLRRQRSERRAQRVRPSRLDRRKTESDLEASSSASTTAAAGAAGSKLRRAGNAVMSGATHLPRQDSTNLLSMNLIERQEYLLKRKKEREQRLRDQQSQKETEECTHRPSTFTRKDSFRNIESVIKHDPGATWSESPTNRKRKDGTPGAGTSSAQSRERLVAEVADPPSEGSDESTPDRKKTPVQRQKPASRMLELASCTSALLDACKLDLMNRSTPGSTQFKDTEAHDDAPSGPQISSERDADALTDASRANLKYRFAANSTEDKGKVQIQDHADFQLDSFYRKRDRGSAKPGVSLLMGRREDDFTEQVVAVIFDRSKFEEVDADDWMHKNIHRFPRGRRELIEKLRS